MHTVFNRLRFSVYHLYYKITSVFLCVPCGTVVQCSVFHRLRFSVNSSVLQNILCVSLCHQWLCGSMFCIPPLAVLCVPSVLQNHLCVSLCRKWLCGSMFCIQPLAVLHEFLCITKYPLCFSVSPVALWFNVLYSSRLTKLTTHAVNPLIIPKNKEAHTSLYELLLSLSRISTILPATYHFSSLSYALLRPE